MDTARSTDQTNPEQDKKVVMGVDLARDSSDTSVIVIQDVIVDTLSKFQAMTDKLLVTERHHIDPVIEHSIDGIASEAGELVDAAKRVKWYGTEIDYTNILEECGDIMFYLDKLVRKCGSSFEEVMRMNMAKLAKRYEDFEFTKDQAVNRDLRVEREILEKATEERFPVEHYKIAVKGEFIKADPTCSTCVKFHQLNACKKAQTLSGCEDHVFV